MANAVVASVGELLVEFICTETGGHNLRPAAYVGPFPSGAPGIFIDQAARMGARAIFAGAVGDDAFGVVLRERLTGAGVDVSLIDTRAGIATGTAHVAYNGDGSRDFVFNIAGSAAGQLPDAARAIAASHAAGVKVIHVSGSTLGDPAMRARVMDIVRALKSGGVAVSFDPNIRSELITDAGYLATVRDLIALSDFVLPSDGDAALLFPGLAFEDWASEVLARGARVVVLKRGAGGCTGRDATGTYEKAGHAVTVVDPTGAGDCFCATLVTSLMLGDDLARALTLANGAGALAVGRLGPMEGNSTRAEIDAFLAGRR